jgi:competence protein ComEA
MNKWATILFGLVCGLLAAGVILLVSMPPRGEPVRLQPPPTPGPLTVHVTGAVANPGVYTLPLEARVQDALDAAGGVTTGADTTSLNLAARLQDGERVYIPLTPQEQPSDTGGASAGGNGEVGALLVDLNTATQAELEGLPGIGPVTAQNIIADREANGPFQTIEDLERVPGIGPATFERLAPLITVDGAP